jgi:hypothetical protein
MFFCCIAVLITAQGSLTDTLWTDSTEHYSVSVHYPEVALENQAVGGVLEEYATDQVQDFMDLFEEYYADDPLLSGLYLSVNFKNEPSPDGLLCITAYVWDYTGGAHGNSTNRAFVFDLATDSLLGPVELLGGQAEFEAFAEEVIEKLNETMVDESWVVLGASPLVENYHTVIPVPDDDGGIAGYTVIFPPYQAACYACGPVEVFIPSE